MPAGGARAAYCEIGDTGTSRLRAAVHKLHRRPSRRKASARRKSRFHPTLPTWAVQQVVGYLGHTCRDANIVVTAARDPKPSFATGKSVRWPSTA